eukprot:8079025-Prorocentrum_lima.AAC.1
MCIRDRSSTQHRNPTVHWWPSTGPSRRMVWRFLRRQHRKERLDGSGCSTTSLLRALWFGC